MANDQDRYDDEGIDRLVAGAYFFRTVTQEQWEDFVRARAGFYSAPEGRRQAERERFIQRLPFVRALIDRDRADIDHTRRAKRARG